MPPTVVIGDLLHAKLFICVLNPRYKKGCNTDDCFKTDDGEGFVIDNLSQGIEYPFKCGCFKGMDTPGVDYWKKIFNQKVTSKSLVRNIAKEYKKHKPEQCVKDEDIFNLLSKMTAIIELFPYHTEGMKDIPNYCLEKMPSVVATKKFVRECLIPLAEERSSDVCLIFARSIEKWGVEKYKNKSGNIVFNEKLHTGEKLRTITFSIEQPMGIAVFNLVKEWTKDKKESKEFTLLPKEVINNISKDSNFILSAD